MMNRATAALALDRLRELVGPIDVYLFDQILKGRFPSGCKILDAGCGGGRNLFFFLQAGYEVTAVDENPAAVAATRELAERLAPDLPAEDFRVATLDALPFGDGAFGAVIASAVLHFARDEAHFRAMVGELWRVLAPGGFFFARLASTIGIEDEVERIGETGRRFHLPDGSDRFLVEEPFLAELAQELGARAAEPLKTVQVAHLRSMTNWLLVKEPPGESRGTRKPRRSLPNAIRVARNGSRSLLDAIRATRNGCRSLWDATRVSRSPRRSLWETIRATRNGSRSLLDAIRVTRNGCRRL